MIITTRCQVVFKHSLSLASFSPRVFSCMKLKMRGTESLSALLEEAVEYPLGGLLDVRQGVVPVERREGRLVARRRVRQPVEDEPAQPHDRALLLLSADEDNTSMTSPGKTGVKYRLDALVKSRC